MAERRQQEAQEQQETQAAKARQAASRRESQVPQTDAPDEATADNPREEQGARYATGTDGVQRLVAGPDDEQDGDDPVVGPAPVVMAPQNWDDNAAQFSAGKLDPFADNADAVNEAQSKATIAHQIKGESS